MKLSGIIWLEEIVEKIERKHRVTLDDVREILTGPSHFGFVREEPPERRKPLLGDGTDEFGSVLDCVFRPQDNPGSFDCVGARHDRQ